MKKTVKVISLVLILGIVITGLTGCKGTKEGYEIKKGAENTIEKSKTQISETEKNMHNAQFSAFEGKISGALAKSLISTVIASNNGGQNAKQVELEGITKVSDIKGDSKYNVKMEKDDDGIISVITIEEED